MHFDHGHNFGIVIASPSNMNGMYYVINDKIKTEWLGFAKTQASLKNTKNNMVICDNVPLKD